MTSYFTDRRQRMKIGASEIPAAIGEGHYQTPRELAASWNSPDDKPQTDAMRMGQLIEGPIITMLQERGIDVAPWPQDKRATHPDFPSIEITPDAITPDSVIECKSLRAYHEDALADAATGRFRGALRQYAIQALAQAHILDKPAAFLAIWCDGTLHLIQVEADDLPTGAEICQRAEAFMARLAAGEPQPIHKRDEWPNHGKASDDILADATVDQLVAAYVAAKQAQADAEEEAKAIAAQIVNAEPLAKRIIGTTATLTRVSSTRQSVSWKQVAEACNPPADLIEQHTTTAQSDYLRIKRTK
jgi:hypothetical protein